MEAALKEMLKEIKAYEATVDKKFIAEARKLLASIEALKKSGKYVTHTTRTTLDATKAQMSKHLGIYIKCRKTPNAEVVRLTKACVYTIDSFLRTKHKSISTNNAVEECEMRLEVSVVKERVVNEPVVNEPVETSYDEELEALMENVELVQPVVKEPVETIYDEELEALMANAKLAVPVVVETPVVAPKTKKGVFNSWMVYRRFA